MISLLFVAMISAQTPAPELAGPETAEAKAKPEKICKRRVRSTPANGISGLKTFKICKTKEEWEKSKSGSSE